ncbi:MAG: hypothetical protein LBK03_02100 [Bacteroidales bacterium]|jgi:hypothetical protein|nr:hypothetical protein [Bacteroidales bacterium]
MKIKTLFRIFLVIVALFFALLAFRSIMRPEKFKKVYELRKSEIVNRLTTLRAVEAVYKTEFKRYTADIDSLVEFANNGYISIVKNVGEIPEGMTEAEALKRGILTKQTIKVPAKNKILEIDPNVQFGTFKHFQYIPETNRKKFEIQVSSLKSKTYEIPVYRVEVEVDDILSNMEKSISPEESGMFTKFWNYLIYNRLPEEQQYKSQYGIIWLGSLSEANTAGSWE